MVYKHPITNLNQFVSYFESKFQKLQSATCKFYICGNLSTDFFNIHNDKKVSQYANFLTNYNATNLETKVNRIIFRTSIVHIYTNKINVAIVILLGLSDHFPLVVEIQQSNMIKPEQNLQYIFVVLNTLMTNNVAQKQKNNVKIVQYPVNLLMSKLTLQTTS